MSTADFWSPTPTFHSDLLSAIPSQESLHCRVRTCRSRMEGMGESEETKMVLWRAAHRHRSPVTDTTQYHHVPGSSPRSLHPRPLPCVERETQPGMHPDTRYFPFSRSSHRPPGIRSEYTSTDSHTAAAGSDTSGLCRSTASKPKHTIF